MRHFSMQVCNKVEGKMVTSYNQVADELVEELSKHPIESDPLRSTLPTSPQKNVRRRVYDVLNVLMAMNIIKKDRKVICWVGFPDNVSREYQTLQDDVRRREQRVRHKRAQLKERIVEQIGFKRLVRRNRAAYPAQPPDPTQTIRLPFMLISTAMGTKINCHMDAERCAWRRVRPHCRRLAGRAPARPPERCRHARTRCSTSCRFVFDNVIQLHEDTEIVKRMNMAFGLERAVPNYHNGDHDIASPPPVALTPQQLEEAEALVPRPLIPRVRGAFPMACLRRSARDRTRV